MQTYTFTAINEAGNKIRGEHDANDENELDEHLKSVGLELRSFSEKTEARGRFKGRATFQDMSIMCAELSLALRASIPVVEALDIVRLGTTSMPIRGALTGIRDDIRKHHKGLTEAFSYYPKLFNSFFLGLIGIGEKSGHLADVLDALGSYMKWMHDLRRRFIKVVRYPLISASFTTGVIWMFFIHIVYFILYQKYTLPEEFIAMLHMIFGSFVIYGWYIILFGPLIIIYSCVILYRNVEFFTYQLDRFFLTLPVLGEVLIRLNTARFLYFFSVMYNSGVGIEESLRDAIKVVKIRPLRESFEPIASYVRQGYSLSNSVERSRAFPPLVVNAFRTGEQTGEIGKSLETVNYFYHRQVDDAVDAFAAHLRTVLLIMAGIFLVT